METSFIVQIICFIYYHQAIKLIKNQAKLNRRQEIGGIHTKLFLCSQAHVMKVKKGCRYIERESWIFDNYAHWGNLIWIHKRVIWNDADFKEPWKACREPLLVDMIAYLNCFLQDGFLFKGEHFCIPRGPTRDSLVRVTW